MNRRAFIAFIGGAAAAWPLAARAQQHSVMPVIGFLHTRSEGDPIYSAFLKGLEQAGFVGGRSVRIEHRWAAGQYDRLAARLPTIYNFREYVEVGGLMSYGPNIPDLFRRAADYVDKILRGAKPGEIPVEQATKFDLVINLTTAKALGLTIPESFLLRADEVIE
jgi:putative ABC transport system substrate-binding protein